MKLLDVMKKYDRCVVRESAKLTKIYNLLLKESEEAEDIEEAEVCPDCGEDPCVCESDKEVDATEEVNEDDSNVMTAEEFFAEAEKAAEEANERGQSEEATNKVEEAEDDISAEEFFSEADNKEADVDEAEEMMSAEEFFSEAEGETKEDVDEAEEMMSAEEFFSEAEGDIHEYELEFDFDDGTGSGNKTDKVEASSLEDAISKLEANGYGSITKVYYASEDGKEISLDENDAEGKEDVSKSDEMMSAEEFFAESGEKEADEQKEQVDEAEEDIDEEEEEKKLEESLKSYRRANHRLFNN